MASSSPKATIQLDRLSSQERIKALKDSLGSWDNQALIDYAVRTTQALLDEQKALQNLTERYNSTQDWAMGQALVEEIGQNLSSTLDLNEVLTRLLLRTYNAIDVEDGSIMLIEEGTGDLVAQIVLGFVSETFRVPKGQGIAGQIAETGVPIIVNNAQDDPRFFNKIDQDTGFVTKSILGVPLLTHDKIIGVMEVFNKKSGPFTQADQMLLSSIANYAGIAIENARLHQRVVAERNHVIHVQEEVSNRLQRDLHDGPTQLVAAIQMGLDFTRQALNHNRPELADEEIRNMQKLAERASHQLRTLLFELRPLVLETKGLVAALETFIERRQAETEKPKLQLVLKSDKRGNQISRLEAKSEAALFAIIQEAVNNALKYAKADNIFVRLEQEKEQLTIRVVDDGAGFDVASVTKNYEERGSYGMVNLRERVAIAKGDYTLTSEIGSGTELKVEVPVIPPSEG